MARQSNTPVNFDRQMRRDQAVAMTSGRAGKVVPLTYIPLLRGDSAAGSVGIDIELGEMPRPLYNGVVANFQAWFVPKAAHPKFSGMDEFMHSYQEADIKQLGAADRTPPTFFETIDGVDLVTAKGSEFFRTLGLHVPTGKKINTDLIDAFWVVYNFRLAAHSSRLTLQGYAQEGIYAATALPKAFWPTGPLSHVVADYEQALIVGQLGLDVQAGRVPLQGISASDAIDASAPSPGLLLANDDFATSDDDGMTKDATWYGGYRSLHVRDEGSQNTRTLFAEMAGQNVISSLADIDAARTTQAFAKLRTAYAGTDATGYDNDDAIIAELMQGFRVDEDINQRPWLLDSKLVPFGMVERHATDGANLTDSVSQGRTGAQLSLNVPQTDTGGVIIVTVEVVPERLQERMGDTWLTTETPSALPNALRDVQRAEPVDMVENWRVDALHTNPDTLYGYEAMNKKWDRTFTRLGGDFFQEDPNAPVTDQRSAIWDMSIVDPAFTVDHYLVPVSLPHDVFSDTLADAFEAVVRHSVAISGLTQIGDVLVEDNSDWDATHNA